QILKNRCPPHSVEKHAIHLIAVQGLQACCYTTRAILAGVGKVGAVHCMTRCRIGCGQCGLGKIREGRDDCITLHSTKSVDLHDFTSAHRVFWRSKRQMCPSWD
ncbi:unnamed protein product, partial [Mycena citricolor]